MPKPKKTEKDRIGKLIDKLEDCLKTKHIPDRFGDYGVIVLDRRKARCVLKKFLVDKIDADV